MKIKSKFLNLFLVWFISFILWFLYRAFFNFTEYIDEFVVKPIIFIGPVFIYLKLKEDVSLDRLGFVAKGMLKILLWGVGFGVLLVIENLYLMNTKGWEIAIPTVAVLVVNALVSLYTAFSEEILYRGFLLQRLSKIIQTPQLATILVAFLFMLHHLGIAFFGFGYSGYDLFTYLLTIFVSGYAYGFIYQKTGSIYAPIIAHALWNLGSVLLV